MLKVRIILLRTNNFRRASSIIKVSDKACPKLRVIWLVKKLWQSYKIVQGQNLPSVDTR